VVGTKPKKVSIDMWFDLWGGDEIFCAARHHDVVDMNLSAGAAVECLGSRRRWRGAFATARLYWARSESAAPQESGR